VWPGGQEPVAYGVLAALVASLRRELAGAVTALEQARAELADARERIAELEARLRQNPRNSYRPPSSEGLASRAAPLACGVAQLGPRSADSQRCGRR
jgi:transposase